MKEFYKEILVWVLIVAIGLMIFLLPYIAPTSATVEDFFRENNCQNSYNPHQGQIKNDYNGEYYCAYNLRERTRLMWGKIYLTNSNALAGAYNPFGYFSYYLNDEFHTYVLVITRDEGVLVYNPINGDFIGKYDSIVSEMDCGLPPTKGSFFSTAWRKLSLQTDTNKCYSSKVEKA
ncbi:MAG TPA: hypothetical protein VJB94_03290 [Candidatus Nanoarchaeia archaeon]|nr:hypothetical protein [Candidatus Nanoarchaeia archaeon]